MPRANGSGVRVETPLAGDLPDRVRLAAEDLRVVRSRRDRGSDTASRSGFSATASSGVHEGASDRTRHRPISAIRRSAISWAPRSTPPVVMASRNSAGGMVSDRRFNFGALTVSCSSRRGRNTSSPMSEAESEKVRSALTGSKARSRRMSKRTVSMNAPGSRIDCASGVGCIEAPCRTKSSSPNTSRSLPSEKLTVG